MEDNVNLAIEFETDTTKYYELIDYICKSGNFNMTINELVTILPDTIFDSILDSMNNFLCFVEFPDEGDECARIMSMLRRSKVRTVEV